MDDHSSTDRTSMNCANGWQEYAVGDLWRMNGRRWQSITMTDVVVVCEGRTEQAFINEVVQPALATSAVFLDARLISTSSGAKGGALSRDRVVGDLCRVLRQRGDTYVTTFFDLYGLPADFPGKAIELRTTGSDCSL